MHATTTETHAETHAETHTGTHTCAGCLDRRQLLQRAGAVTAVAAGVAVLAACGGSSGGSSATPGADGSLAKVADIPVGGALAATDADGNKILLIQATAGVVTAVSAICTHQGCTVAPGKGALVCPCHGSTFDLTGAVTHDPATEPLPTVAVHVKDGAVFSGAA
ncbi:Rieske (2Fe-2S) protein [Cellulomonas sp. HZM]|uniref:Rieske (2Fe-2S) protein n=1 Tax=Cellulomonas sp. HZM TaxID=1454010 RepID=UPI00068B803B|nr:Rieske (2Fe-2S) protein [Cellulomonas sp. HZM]